MTKGEIVDEIVIDANMDLQWPHRISWCHHLTEDVEDPADDAEDPGDGPEALMDVGEALDGWKKH